MVPHGLWTFPALARSDLPLLHRWHTQAHVRRAWGDAPSEAELAADWLSPPADPRIARAHVACLDGAPRGFIQAYHVMSVGEGWWPDERDPGAWGIDFFLGEATATGRGLGRAMLRAFSDRLLQEPGSPSCRATPSRTTWRPSAACWPPVSWPSAGWPPPTALRC